MTLERILELHGRQISKFGGTDGHRRPCVESALGAGLSASMYSEHGNDPFRLLVYVFRSLLQNHCFVDGNKRVALATLLDGLLALGLTLETTPMELAEFCETAVGFDVEEMSSWFGERLVALRF